MSKFEIRNNVEYPKRKDLNRGAIAAHRHSERSEESPQVERLGYWRSLRYPLRGFPALGMTSRALTGIVSPVLRDLRFGISSFRIVSDFDIRISDLICREPGYNFRAHPGLDHNPPTGRESGGRL